MPKYSDSAAIAALKIAAHVCRERIARPKVTRRGEVPYSIAAVTPDWLTEVLCKGRPRARVTEVRIEHASTGTHARHRVSRSLMRSLGRGIGSRAEGGVGSPGLTLRSLLGDSMYCCRAGVISEATRRIKLNEVIAGSRCRLPDCPDIRTGSRLGYQVTHQAPFLRDHEAVFLFLPLVACEDERGAADGLNKE